jgi:hypothetical protein
LPPAANLRQPCRVGGIGKRLTPLGGPATPTRGFTAAVSVFRGTPPPKPFPICYVRWSLAFRRIKDHTDAPSPPGHTFRTILLWKQEKMYKKLMIQYKPNMVIQRCPSGFGHHFETTSDGGELATGWRTRGGEGRLNSGNTACQEHMGGAADRRWQCQCTP